MGIESETFFLGSESAARALIRHIEKLPRNGTIRVDVYFEDPTKPAPRTTQQNNALHKWLDLLAEALNDAGIPFGDVVIKLPRRFTKENLKELVLRPMLNALYPDKISTTKLSTTEIQELYMHVDQVIAERSGVHVEWPSRED